MPQTAAGELQEAGAPQAVRNWIAQPPAWCEIRPDPPSDPALQFSIPANARPSRSRSSLHASRLLIDEWEGRAKAERRHCASPVPWASWPRPTNSICSISSRRSRAFVGPTFIFPRSSSIVCAVGCPPEWRNRDTAWAKSRSLLTSKKSPPFLSAFSCYLTGRSSPGVAITKTCKEYFPQFQQHRRIANRHIRYPLLRFK